MNKKKAFFSVIAFFIFCIATFIIYLQTTDTSTITTEIGSYYAEDSTRTFPKLNEANSILIQPFTTTFNGLEKIDIRLGTNNVLSTNSPVSLVLTNHEGTIIATREVSLDDFDNYTYVTLNVDSSISKDEKLFLQISQEQTDSDTGMFAFCVSNERTDGENAIWNNSVQDYSVDAVYTYHYLEQRDYSSFFKLEGIMLACIFLCAIIFFALLQLSKYSFFQKVLLKFCNLCKKIKLLCYKRKNLCWFIFTICLFPILFFLCYSKDIKNSYIAYSSTLSNIFVAENDTEYKISIPLDYDALYLPIVALSQQDDISVSLEITVNGHTFEQSLSPQLYDGDCSTIATSLSPSDMTTLFNKKMQFIQLENVSNWNTVNFKFMIPDNASILLAFDLNYPESIAYKISKSSSIAYYILGIVFLIWLIGSAIFFFCLRQINLLPEKVYFALAIFMGCIFFILFPTGTVNDSTTHIFRIYQLVNTTLGKSDWNELHYTTLEGSDNYIIERSLYDSEQDFAQPNVKNYSTNYITYAIPSDLTPPQKSRWHVGMAQCNILDYLPYYLVMLIGRLLNLDFMLILNLMKISGFLVYLISIYWTIKLIPYGKEGILIFSLNPIFLQSMITIGYDLFCVNAFFLAIAIILRWFYSKTITLSSQFTLYILLILMTSAKKGVYCVLFLAIWLGLLLLDSNGRKILKNHTTYILSSCISVICMFIALNVSGISERVTRSTDYYNFEYLLQHLGSSVIMIISSILHDFSMLLQGMFGGRLGWNEAVIPWWIVITYILLFITATLKKDIHTPLQHECLINFLSILAFIFGMYATFLFMTPLTNKYVFGLQGRYFIQLIPLLIILLKHAKIQLDYDNKHLYLLTWFAGNCSIFFMLGTYLTR